MEKEDTSTIREYNTRLLGEIEGIPDEVKGFLKSLNNDGRCIYTRSVGKVQKIQVTPFQLSELLERIKNKTITPDEIMTPARVARFFNEITVG